MSTSDSKTRTIPTSIKERICNFEGALQARDLANIFGVTKNLIYEQARIGTLPSFRIGTAVRFDPRAVCEWYEKQ